MGLYRSRGRARPLRSTGRGRLRTAMEQREPYRQLLAAGLAALWMLQTMVIVGGNLALLPLTGITLPFISFGGSSLVMNFVMLAMMVRVSGEEG